MEHNRKIVREKREVQHTHKQTARDLGIGLCVCACTGTCVAVMERSRFAANKICSANTYSSEYNTVDSSVNTMPNTTRVVPEKNECSSSRTVRVAVSRSGAVEPSAGANRAPRPGDEAEERGEADGGRGQRENGGGERCERDER